jgi:hypothetical protein
MLTNLKKDHLDRIFCLRDVYRRARLDLDLAVVPGLCRLRLATHLGKQLDRLALGHL